MVMGFMDVYDQPSAALDCLISVPTRISQKQFLLPTLCQSVMLQRATEETSAMFLCPGQNGTKILAFYYFWK